MARKIRIYRDRLSWVVCLPVGDWAHSCQRVTTFKQACEVAERWPCGFDL